MFGTVAPQSEGFSALFRNRRRKMEVLVLTRCKTMNFTQRNYFEESRNSLINRIGPFSDIYKV